MHDWSHPDWKSQDGSVVGDLDIDDDWKYVGIWDWSSIVPGKGNTVKALLQLRNQYPNYSVQVCAAMEHAIPYWEKMKQRGLVDKILPIT